jgi:hypothetical protein
VTASRSQSAESWESRYPAPRPIRNHFITLHDNNEEANTKLTPLNTGVTCVTRGATRLLGSAKLHFRAAPSHDASTRLDSTLAMIALPDMTLGFCQASAKLLRLVGSAQTIRSSLLDLSVTKIAPVHALDDRYVLSGPTHD